MHMGTPVHMLCEESTAKHLEIEAPYRGRMVVNCCAGCVPALGQIGAS